jgi:hypothetical protein
LLSPDSIQEGEEKDISVVAQGIPLRIVGYVERIVPTDNFKCISESAVPVSKIFSPLLKTIKKCIKTP